MKRKLLFMAAATIAACSAQAGWYFESTTKSEGGDPRQSEMMSSVARTWMDGDSIKSEFVQSGSPVMPAGSYIVSRDGGATMTLVNPADQTYATMDIAALTGGAMKMMGGMMKLVNPKVESLLDEDGGKLLGYPVRHYKFRTTYTMEMNIFGMKNSTTSETLQEIWASTKVGDDGGTFWKNRNAMSTGDEKLDRLVKNELTKIEGLPLKQITRIRTTDPGGNTQESTVMMEVTSIKEQKVGDETFAVPEGYAETSFMSMAVGGMPKGGDTGDEPSAPPVSAKSFMEMMKKMKPAPAN